MTLYTKKTNDIGPLGCFAIIGLAVALFLAVGWLFQVAWNAVMPGVFGLSALSLPEAISLIIVARILFGGFRGSTQKD